MNENKKTLIKKKSELILSIRGNEKSKCHENE